MARWVLFGAVVLAGYMLPSPAVAEPPRSGEEKGATAPAPRTKQHSQVVTPAATKPVENAAPPTKRETTGGGHRGAAVVGPPRAEVAQSAPAGAVEEVGPEIFYLPDENGKLRPVPGWTLEDFRKLIAQQAAQGQAPTFSLHRLAVRGSVAGNHARLIVEIAVKVSRQRQDQWVRVPLQMNGAILTEPAQTSQGNLILEYQETDGYVVWLRGGADEPLTLTFNMLVPLKNIGGDQQLIWNLPRVAPSQLKLQVPIRNIEAEVAAGPTLLPPVAAQDGSELTVLGMGGELRLSWRAPNQQLSSRSRLFEAEGAHLVIVERGLIRTQAQLTIRSLGGEIDRVRVQLPSGAKLSPGNPSAGYAVTAMDPGPKRPGQPLRPVVEIQPEKKTRGPLNVRFEFAQTYDVADTRTFQELGTVEVEGAARHWGNIAVEVSGDWHLFWGNAANVRRVDAVPATLPSSDLTAAFEYSGQPYVLTARVTPPTTRTTVEPLYIVSVASDAADGAARLKLDARLKYRVSGAKIFELPIDLAGWELEEGGLGPAGRVDVQRVVPAVNGRLKIPFLASFKGEFEITLKARRRATTTDGVLSTELPRPGVDNVAPSTVIVVADDNVQLTPRREAMVGLAPLAVTPSIELPPRVQPPFYYRGENPDARLVADFQVHARTIAAEVTSRAQISERSIAVRQILDFDIAYEAVEWLSIQVPRELAEPGLLKFSLDNEGLSPRDVRQAGGGDAAATTVEMRLPLRKPRIGPAQLHIDYQVPLGRTSSDEKIERALPLVMPADAKVRLNQLVLETATGVTAEPSDRAWSLATDARGAARDDRNRRYQTSGARESAPLILGVQARPNSGSVTIHRGWVQSWFSSGARQDQATYLISSREDRVAVELPDGAEAGAAEVWLDGALTPPVLNAAGSLVLSMPAANGAPHRLVLRYLVPKQAAGWLRRASLPRFPEGTWVQKIYWQLVLPADEHLLSAPANSTAEYLWRRQGLIWGRQPQLNESELAAWLGAPEGDTVAPAAAQRYLLSVSTNGDTYLLPVIPRAALVLLAAGCVLCGGLAWIYYRQVRRPAVVFAALVVLLALGLLFPEPAIVLGQAAALGLGLVLVVAVLRRWLGAPRNETMVVRGGGGSSVGHPSTEFLYQAPATGTGSTQSAAKAPAAAGGASGSSRMTAK